MTYITYITDTTNIWRLKYDTKELIQIRLLEHKKKKQSHDYIFGKQCGG